MKAIAAHAVRVEAFRDCIMVRDRAVTAVERSVETGDLRQLRTAREQRADRRQIVRLVERRQRDVALEMLSTTSSSTSTGRSYSGPP